MKKYLVLIAFIIFFASAKAQNVGIGIATPMAKLDIKGEGTGSSTNTLLLRNSLGDTLFRMRNDGRIGIGYNGTTYGRTLNMAGTGINFYSPNKIFGGSIFPTDTSLVIWSDTDPTNYLCLQPSWGNTGIGTYTPNAKFHLNGAMLIGSNQQRVATGYELSVDGEVIAEAFTTQNSSSWPDYVFEKDYSLMPLVDLKEYVKINKHLPGIPDAAAMEKNGINLGEMTKKLMEKVEELTLHIFELDRKNEELAMQVAQLKKGK